VVTFPDDLDLPLEDHEEVGGFAPGAVEHLTGVDFPLRPEGGDLGYPGESSRGQATSRAEAFPLSVPPGSVGTSCPLAMIHHASPGLSFSPPSRRAAGSESAGRKGREPVPA
jgi:hypothetical protein